MEKEDGTLLIGLSREGEELGEIDEAMLKNMIVLTMTKLSGVERVGVYFGQIRRDNKNNPEGVISAKDIVSEDITSKVGQKTITVYLPNQDKSALVARQIDIQTSINESVERTTVEELFKNTSYTGFSQTVFNPNAKLVSSFVEGDTFFLNFSEPIIKEQTSYEEAFLSVYALINTISDLQPIKNIQILIKGKTNTESAFSELFKAPYFTKNEEIVIQ
jgi:spore germination protein GerM